MQLQCLTVLYALSLSCIQTFTAEEYAVLLPVFAALHAVTLPPNLADFVALPRILTPELSPDAAATLLACYGAHARDTAADTRPSYYLQEYLKILAASPAPDALLETQQDTIVALAEHASPAAVDLLFTALLDLERARAPAAFVPLATRLLAAHTLGEEATHALLRDLAAPLTPFIPHLPFLHTYAPFFDSPLAVPPVFPALYTSYCALAALAPAPFASHLSAALLALPIPTRWELYAAVAPGQPAALADYKRLCKKIPRLEGPAPHQQRRMAELFHHDPVAFAEYYVESVVAYPDAVPTMVKGSAAVLPWEQDLLVWVASRSADHLAAELADVQQGLPADADPDADDHFGVVREHLQSLWEFLVGLLPTNATAVLTVLRQNLAAAPPGAWLFVPLGALAVVPDPLLLPPLLTTNLLFPLLLALEQVKRTTAVPAVFDRAQRCIARLAGTTRTLPDETLPPFASQLATTGTALPTPTLAALLANTIDRNGANRTSLLSFVPAIPIYNIDPADAPRLRELATLFWTLRDDDLGVPPLSIARLRRMQAHADHLPHAALDHALAQLFAADAAAPARTAATRTAHAAHLREVFAGSLPAPPNRRFPAMVARLRWAVSELFLKRVLFSTPAARATAAFVRLLADAEVEFVSPLLLVDMLVSVLPARLPASTPKEAKRIGVCLDGLLRLAARWRAPATFAAECSGAFGFVATQRITHEQFLATHRGWVQTLNQQFVVLAAREAEQHAALACLAECMGALPLCEQLVATLDQLIYSTNNEIKRAATRIYDRRRAIAGTDD